MPPKRTATSSRQGTTLGERGRVQSRSRSRGRQSASRPRTRFSARNAAYTAINQQQRTNDCNQPVLPTAQFPIRSRFSQGVSAPSAEAVSSNNQESNGRQDDPSEPNGHPTQNNLQHDSSEAMEEDNHRPSSIPQMIHTAETINQKQRILSRDVINLFDAMAQEGTSKFRLFCFPSLSLSLFFFFFFCLFVCLFVCLNSHSYTYMFLVFTTNSSPRGRNLLDRSYRMLSKFCDEKAVLYQESERRIGHILRRIQVSQSAGTNGNHQDTCNGNGNIVDMSDEIKSQGNESTL